MTDQTLTIRWGGESYTATPGMEVSVGRDRGCTIVLASAAVSRRHGTFSHAPGGWVYTDEGSTQGSFVGGRAVTRHPITGAGTVSLGQGPDAVVLTVEPASPADNGATALPPTAAVSQESPTRAVPERPAGGQARPGGALSSAGAAATIVPPEVTGDPLTVATPNGMLTVTPGTALTVGREDDNDVVLTDPSVSRHHLRIEHGGDGWTLADLGSSAGTWQDGTRVDRVALSGTQRFTLGERTGTVTVTTDTGAGAAAEVSAGTPAATGANRSTPIIAALVAVVVLLAAVGAGLWWWRGRADPLDQLAKATVLVQSPDGWSGSGTVIDKARGLILTNAHVADPTALGTGVRQWIFPAQNELDGLTPKPFTISVNTGKDTAAEPRFTATPVASDGYLDLAILKIDKTAAGALVTPDDLSILTEQPMASGQVSSGDKITVIGYPGTANSLNPTFTEGVVSGWRGDDRLGTNEAKINVDALVNPGNSGGLAVNSANEMIGVPESQAINPTTGTPTGINQVIPVSMATPLIQAAENGSTYTSPWTVAAPTDATITEVSTSAPGDAIVAPSCNGGTLRTDQPAFAVKYSGFPTGKTLDIMAQLLTSDGKIAAIARSPYPTTAAASGCLTITLTPTASTGLPDGDLNLWIGIGGNYEVIKKLTWTRTTGTGTPSVPSP